MAQKKFPKRKTGRKGRKKKHIVGKHFFKKKHFRKLFNKKKVGKFLEIILTICVLSLAVVVLTHVLRWQPFAASGPENARQTADSEREEYEVLPAEEGPCAGRSSSGTILWRTLTAEAAYLSRR